MQICGFLKTTLLDYPGLLACTIFLGGCNFRCPFCQNGDLVIQPGSQPDISREEILAFLEKRQGILEGVCITGGEPTLAPDLLHFMQSIKDMNYKIKLDTNGSNPEIIRSGVTQGLIDYVAMDIKSSPDTYPILCGTESVSMDSITQSVHLLKSLSIPHEFRTTVVKPYHTSEIMEDIGCWLAGDSPYYLQNFEDSPRVLKQGLSSFSANELHEFRALLLKHMPNTLLRGVE